MANKTTQVVLPEALRDRIVAEAKAQGLGYSAYLRMVLHTLDCRGEQSTLALHAMANAPVLPTKGQLASIIWQSCNGQNDAISQTTAKDAAAQVLQVLALGGE